MQSREERLDLVLQGTNDGIWDWDMRTGEVYFSPRWKSMLGYADDEVANRKDEWNRLLHPNDLERALAAVQDYLDGRTTTYQLEHRLRHKDGTYHWVLARGIALRDEAGRAYRMVGSHTDITDRKHAEQALLESETNLRSLMENARDFAVYRIAVDPSNPYLARVVVASPSLKEVFGIPDLHDFTTWFTPIHPEDLSRIVEANRRSLEMGVPFDQQLRFFNAERGSWVWAHVRSSPVFDTDGRLTHFNGLVVDISEQKRVEDEMRRQDELLQKRLAFENLISRISTEFINLGPNEIDLGIRHALQAIGEFAGADRSYIFLVSGDGTRMANAHKWCAESIEPAIGRVAEVSAESFPWFIERMNRLEIVQIPRVADLPPEAGAEKQEFQSQSTQSLLAVPMVYRGSLVGFVGFDSVRSEKAWDEDSIALLRIVGEIFVNALEHKRAQAIQAGQRQFLELLATGGDFSGTLHTLVRLIEEQWPGMLGLVLLLDVDGRHLHIGASISLPEDYVQSIEGLEIGPMVGSCGTACYRRERVIVEDILTDPRWDGLRDLAVKYGLRACWSEPVFSAGGQVVGTFAMYYRQPRTPTAAELRTIETAAHLVGIAIAHKQAQQELQAAYATLEHRVEERTRELGTLNSIAGVVNQSLDLKAILNDALDRTLQIMNMEFGGAYRLGGGDEDAANGLYLNPLAYRGLSDQFMRFAGRLPLRGSPVEEAMRIGQPLVWQVEASPAEPEMKQALLREGVHQVVSIPLVAKNQLVGALQLGSDTVRSMAPEQLSLLGAIGQQIGVAIDNARLYEAQRARHAEAERRRQVAEGMREILAMLNSKQSLKDTLDYITGQACRLLGSEAAMIVRREGEDGPLTMQAACGLEDDHLAEMRFSIPGGATWRALLERRPQFISDPTCSRKEAIERHVPPGPERDWSLRIVEQYHGLLAAPLVIKGESYGVLTLFYRAARQFSEDEMNLAFTVAHQAALAVENARLREQAEQAAAIAERSRLARELHDSATQSLYSVSLYAEAAARCITDGEQSTAAEYLRELRDTAQEALREMRLLIFELRPPALEKSGLVSALQARLDAVEARGGMQAGLTVEGECGAERLPHVVQEELYHIAQEALNNALKHSHARCVQIRVRFQDAVIRLEVCDDGVGFSPDIAQAGGGLGLCSMQERAQRIGGTLRVESTPGTGTRVIVEAPLASTIVEQAASAAGGTQ